MEWKELHFQNLSHLSYYNQEVGISLENSSLSFIEKVKKLDKLSFFIELTDESPATLSSLLLHYQAHFKCMHQQARKAISKALKSSKVETTILTFKIGDDGETTYHNQTLIFFHDLQTSIVNFQREKKTILNSIFNSSKI